MNFHGFSILPAVHDDFDIFILSHFCSFVEAEAVLVPHEDEKELKIYYPG